MNVNNADVESVVDGIANIIISAADRTVPNKVVTIRLSDTPWMNNSIRKMIKKRNMLHKTAKQSKI